MSRDFTRCIVCRASTGSHDAAICSDCRAEWDEDEPPCAICGGRRSTKYHHAHDGDGTGDHEYEPISWVTP